MEGCLTLTVDQGDIGSLLPHCSYVGWYISGVESLAQRFKYQRPATSLHTDTRIVQ